MANDNVKIVINEVNETRPLGSGVSSDIAYIPGLAADKWVTKVNDIGEPIEYKTVNKLDEYGNKIPIYDAEGKRLFDADGNYLYETELWQPSRNVPVLCNTVDEFEFYFGPTPYVMTASDTVNCDKPHTYQPGDYDKSYLYAKELLNAGMSVIYENICSYDVIEDLANIDVVLTEEQINGPEVKLVEGASNRFYFNAPVTDANIEGDYEFRFTLTTTAKSGDVRALFSLPTLNDTDEHGLHMTVSKFEQILGDGETSKYTVNENDYSISWSDCTELDHKYAQFRIVIHYEYRYKKDVSVAGKRFTLRLLVVDKDVYSQALRELNPTALPGNETVLPDVAVKSKISYLYDNLPEALDRLEDKNEYSVKYITSGGYPTFINIQQEDGSYAYALADAMIDCAAKRGDAVAIIDHIDDPAAPLRYNDEGSFYYQANDYFMGGANNEYGTMFSPWGRYTCVTVTDVARMSQLMPASFGYLMCVAYAIKTSPNWLAMAGVTRGIVPNLKELHTNEILTNVIAEDYQPKYGKNLNNISVNAITNVKPYGLTIWGNRTLETVHERGTTAHNFLNTRNMVSDIKKLAYSTAKQLMFEQDSDVLWLKFKSGISPLLDQLVGGFGISGYKIIRGTTKYNGQALTRGELAAVIKIFPLYAIEYFEITVVLADEDVTVS